MSNAVLAYCNRHGGRHVLARIAARDGVLGVEYRAMVIDPSGIFGTWSWIQVEDDTIESVTAMCPCDREYHFCVQDLIRAYTDQRTPLILTPDKFPNPLGVSRRYGRGPM